MRNIIAAALGLAVLGACNGVQIPDHTADIIACTTSGGTWDYTTNTCKHPDPCAGKTPICVGQGDVDCWAVNANGACQFWPKTPTDPCTNVVCSEHKHCNSDGACAWDDGYPLPTPEPGCVLSGEPTTSTDSPNLFGDVVNQAMHELHPECDIGGRCVLGDTTPNQWYAAVNAKLREKGYCAGRHTENTDEIAVAVKATDPWLGYHIFSGDDSDGPLPPGAPQRTIKWSPQAYTGAWLPPDQTPPVTDGCPVANCPLREWTVDTLPPGWDPNLIGKPTYVMQWKYHTMGNNDSTPYLQRQCEYCSRVMNDPTRCGCPVLPDGSPDRPMIENWLMYGGFLRDSRNGQDCTPNNTDNPAAWLAGTGNCRMCNANKTVCTEWN